ncbi:MAG: OmpA family protein [Desulfatiglandaceae bacterium]
MSKSIAIRLAILSALILLSGCGHKTYYDPPAQDRFYTPKKIPIKSGMILDPGYRITKTVTLINAQTDTENVLLGSFTHPWWGNLKAWTDTAVGLAADELQKRDVAVTDHLPLFLKLSITHAALSWEPRSIACTLNLRVITGNGDVLDFRGTNSAIDLEDSCDGAVTRQVTAMFRDPRILAYLEAPPEPKDSDCDGVPDDTDECPNTPLGVVVDERGCSLDSDGDGVPHYLDECPGTPQGVEVDPRGCPLDTDEDGVFDYKDKCPGTPRGARVDMDGCWVIHEPLFDFDKSKIKPRYYSVLDDVVKVLKQNPSVRIVIEGHTDNIGTKKYNQKLSEERARAVEQYLIQKGITEERLKTVGYGSSRPKATNKTDAGRVLNRRVKLEPLPRHPK